jgi:hypothetical protein
MRVFMSAYAWSLALLIAVVGCKHDLDKLRSGRSAGMADGGSGGSGGAGSSTARDAGSEDGAAGSEPPADACEPCDELSSTAMQLALRSCCRGVGGGECGLTFGAGTLCLPGSVPGQPDSVCSGASAGGMRLAGCCRPDSRCGLDASETGLGCVAREIISEHLGDGSAEPAACRYECEDDAECNTVAGGFVCTADPAGGARFCAKDCARDADCAREFESVCAFASDPALNRVLAICRSSVGDVNPGDPCTAATDCVHGVCLAANRAPYCTDFCRSNADCADDRPTCFAANIPRPDGGTVQSFSICRK